MFTVKKVKVNNTMSEETLCFSCDVYENGKLIAHAENRGMGGNTLYRPAKGLTFKDVKHLDKIDNDCKIMDIVELTNITKKYQSRSFVLKKGDQILTQKFPNTITKLKKNPTYKQWVSKMKEKFKKEGFELLNTNL